MEQLISSWPTIAARLRSARHVLLMTDFDGTLTPIAERPELADLSPATRSILQSLARLPDFTIGVISGRALVDLREKVGVSGLVYAGNHGLEIEGQGISLVHPIAEEMEPVLRVLQYVLSSALRTIKGAFVEDKKLSLSVHYRLVDESQSAKVENIVREVVGRAEAAGQAKITRGKKVYEVRPSVTWDKGKAVKLLMKKYGKGGRKSGLVPLYLGDDLTDEDGFRAIEAYGMGISVFVGEAGERSNARYCLKSPAEVFVFLKMLLDQAQNGFTETLHQWQTLDIGPGL